MAARLATVFGGSGFVGGHVVNILLSKGWAVRCVVRDTAKAGWLKDIANKHQGRLELASVTLDASPAIGEKEAALNSALEGATAAFFCAGFENQSPETIDFMVNNAVGVVRAARQQRVGVVVLTSSGGSTNPPGHKNEVPKQEHVHWSDPEVQKANGRFSPAAKTLMEINALLEVGRNQGNEIVDEAKAAGAPRLCIMNPNLILGPQLAPGPVAGNSLPWMLRLFKGEQTMPQIPNDSMSIIDVRDLAALHVACAERADASGKYFGVNRSFRWEEIFAAFQAALPTFKVPPRFEGEAAVATQFDHTRKQSLGVPLRDIDEIMRDLVNFFRERGDLPRL